MTHKPLVPTASQSPYPLHPLPGRRQRLARPGRQPVSKAEATPRRIPAGLVIGLGFGAAAAILLLLRRR